MFGQSLLSAFGIACTTDTDQLFGTDVTATSTATYQLNNATTSIPSNTYPGTANNITYTSGKFGNAAVFNGSNADIDISSSAINTTSPYTISMWLNIVDVTQYKGIFANVTSSRLTNEIAVVLNSGKITIYSVVSNGNTNLDAIDVTPQSAIVNNTWFNLVIVADRSATNKAKVFFNSVEGSYVYRSGAASTASYSNIKVGIADGQYFNGKIDQIRFFNSSLPQAAVTALYNETTTTASSASIDYVDANPNSIAYYKMSDATDQLGNYNGTATNVNFNTEGKFGFAGAFNGSNADIDLPSNIDSTTMSISFWIYIDSIVTGNEVVIELENGYGVWFLANAAGKLGMQSSNANSAHTLSNSQLSAGAWHHVAAVWNSGSRTFYIDNTVQSGGSVTDYLTCNENTIGSRRSGEFFDGKIDQIRIYDSAISAADVTTLYKEVECEPAAINALANFNTVLYVGNNTTNVINTVGFEPGLVWVKTRNNNKNHVLVDALRGVSSVLEADTSAAAATGTDFTSFDTNGFTLAATNAVYMNPSGTNMVSWNWKAPLANLSTGFNGSSTVGSASKIDLTGSTTLTTRSISLWVNLAGTGSGGNLILDNSDGQNPGVVQYGKWVIQLQYGGTNYFCWDTYTGGSYGICDVNYTFNLNTWYHIVFVAEANNQAVYINGVSQTLQNVSRAAEIGTVTMSTNRLGASWSTQYTHALNGKMGQVRIFNDALTANEVADLYTEPAASNNTLNYPAGAGCIAAYPLQTDAVDLSGNYSGASSNVTFGQPGYLTSNTDGTITSAVAVNQEAGFSIVKYTGNGIAGSTVGHNLGVKPDLIIWKNTSATSNWLVYSPFIGNDSQWLYLNLDSAAQTSGSANEYPTNKVDPTSSVVTVNGSGSSNNINISGQNTIMYCFTSIPGYSKIGSYVGTGTTGNFQYIGFQPRFVMLKNTDFAGQGWSIWDSARSTSNPRNLTLFPNDPQAEYTQTNGMNFNSTGFEILNGTNWMNKLNSNILYLAIA